MRIIYNSLIFKFVFMCKQMMRIFDRRIVFFSSDRLLVRHFQNIYLRLYLNFPYIH